MSFLMVEIIIQTFKGSVFALRRHVAPSRGPYLHNLLQLTSRGVTEKHLSTGLEALQIMQTMKLSLLTA